MTTHRSPSPEDQLNDYLDALVSGRPTPPPGEIDATVPAESARELHDLASAAEVREQGPLDEIWASILGATDEPANAPTERKAPMLRATTLTTPNGTARPIREAGSRPAGWMGRVSQGFATAMVVALLVALVGGVYVREFGLPTGGGDPTRAPGLAASPEATSDSALSCASPGYRPVVEGEVDADALAAIGMTETPLNIDGAHVNIPTSSGEVVTLANTWTPIGGPMWSNPTQANSAGEATIRNIDTGEEWTLPDTTHPLSELYIPPYLIMPANSGATDFRIVDTETDAEVLVSELRGQPFPTHVRASPIAAASSLEDGSNRPPTVLLFSSDETAHTGLDIGEPDDGPNALVLLPNLDDAHFIADRVFAQYRHETAYSSETNQLAYATEIDGEPAVVVIRPGSDERVVVQHRDFTVDALPLMFSTDGTTLVVSQPGALFTFDLGSETPSDPVIESTFGEQVMPIAHNAESMSVLVLYPDRQVAILDSVSGEVTELPGVTLPEAEFPPTDSTDRYSFETAVFEIFDDETSTVRFVDLVNGTVSPETTVLNPEDDYIRAATQSQYMHLVQYPQVRWSSGYAWLDEMSALHVSSTDPAVDPWSMPAPEGFAVNDFQVAQLLVNPSESCIVLNLISASGYSQIRNGETLPRVTSWIAPLERDAEWTRLDVQLTGWFPTFEEPEPQTLPAQDFGTPVATPQVRSSVSCNSPGYRPIVSGEVDPSDLDLIGGDPILHNGESTIMAANGTEITFDEDQTWGVNHDGRVALSGDEGQQPDTITSLATGESWTFPTIGRDDSQSPISFVIHGPWLFGPVDDTATNWRVINTHTGESRLTSDLFGAPFAEASQPMVSGSQNLNGQVPTIISFIPDAKVDLALTALVLPSADLDDAWALDPSDADATNNGAITSNGSRIAYVPAVRNDRVVVLDGFTGERLAYHRAPASDDMLDVVDLTNDDTRLVLRDSQHVSTVDLDTGEIVTILDPEGEIHSFEYDATTGTALATTGSGPAMDRVWIDPASAKVKRLGADNSVRYPFPKTGWAVIETRNDSSVDYALLDMATGELVSNTVSRDRDEVVTESSIFGGEHGAVVIQGEPGVLLILDGPDGTAFEMPVPGEHLQSWSAVTVSISPNAECVAYTRGGSADEPGTSWLAPLEPDADWTELPFQLSGWVKVPGDTAEPQLLPAQDFSTPVVNAATPSAPDATPAATPQAASSLNGVIIVEGDAEQARIEGDVAIATLGEDGLTLPLANGETVTIPDVAHTNLRIFGDSRLLVHNDGQEPRVIDVTTGEVLFDLPEFQTWGRDYGRWYMVPTDDTLTDWIISDTVTGETRLLSDVVDLPGTTVMPAPVSERFTGDTHVFHVGFGEIDGAEFDVTDIAARTFVIAGSLDRTAALPDYPTGRQRVGTPVLVDAGDGQRVAYETRGGDSRIIVLDTTTGRVLTRFSASDVGDDPTLAGFLNRDTIVVVSEDQVLTLSAQDGSTEVVRDGLDDVDNPLLYTPDALLYFRQGNTLKQLNMPTGELTEVVSGLLPDAFGFTKPGSDWITFQTQDGHMLVDARTGEVVSQMQPPASDSYLPEDWEQRPWWSDADGDTVIFAYTPQATPGSIWMLSPAFPDGLEITGPSDMGFGAALVSSDGRMLYWYASDLMAGPGELWATPLGTEPKWELVAEGIAFRTFLPLDAAEPGIVPAQELATPAAFVPDLQTSDDVSVSFNLRAEPTTASIVVTVLPSGTPLMDLGKDAPTTDPNDGDRWLSVATEDGRTGWIRDIDLEPYVASAAASPVATPERTGALDGVVIVEGDAEQARIQGDVAIATLGEDGLTLPLANGEPVVIPEVEHVDLWPVDGKLWVSREGQPVAVVDLASGEIVHELPAYQPFSQWYGRWYLIPIDDTLTDWTIADIDSGETRLLSEIVDLPGDKAVMPFAYNFNPMNETNVLSIQPVRIEGLRTNPSGAPIAHIAITELPDRVVEAHDYPTILDRTGGPALVETDDGRVIAYETRADDDRIVVVDTTTGEELVRYSVDTVGEDPTLAGFLDADTLVITSGSRVMSLSSHDGSVEILRDGRSEIDNPLLYVAEAILYFTQGDTVMRLHLPTDELTEIASGFVRGALSFTRHEGSDWIFFQTQTGVTLVDARSGEIVSQTRLPGARGGFPDVNEMNPWQMDADGDTLIIATRGQTISSSGVPGSIFVLSPEFPNGLEITGPSNEHPLGTAYLSPDGTTLYATTAEVSSASDLWVTPLSEEPSWELVAEAITVRTFIPLNESDS